MGIEKHSNMPFLKRWGCVISTPSMKKDELSTSEKNAIDYYYVEDFFYRNQRKNMRKVQDKMINYFSIQ